MASELLNLTPDAVNDSGNNWTTNSGDTNLLAELENTNSSYYLKSNTDGVHNTFEFDDADVARIVNIQWIKYIVSYGSSVANEPMTFKIYLINGIDASTFYATEHDVTAPPHTAKVYTLDSGIIPYVGSGGSLPSGIGGTIFSGAQVNGIKIKLEATDVDTTGGGNYMEIFDLQIYAMLNVTDPDPPGTYTNTLPNVEFKNGLIELKNGSTIIK